MFTCFQVKPKKMMKKTLIVLGLLALFLLLFTIPTMATCTLSANSIDEGDTYVSTIADFSVTITTNNTVVYNITLTKGGVYVTSKAESGVTTGVKTLDLGTMDAYTSYRINVTANDTYESVEVSYNFTTGASKLTEQTDTFSTGEIALLGIITIIIIIGLVVTVVKDVKEKKLNVKSLVNKLILIMFFVIVIVIIASLI